MNRARYANASNVSGFSAFPENPHFGSGSNVSSDLYIKPLIEEIKMSSQKVLQKSAFLLKNESKISKNLFKIAFGGKDRFNILIKDTRKIVNKSKFMAFSQWIPLLIDNIYENLEEHAVRLQQDKKFDLKLN
jgi:lysine/ornithine N-monooxygenase